MNKRNQKSRKTPPLTGVKMAFLDLVYEWSRDITIKCDRPRSLGQKFRTSFHNLITNIDKHLQKQVREIIKAIHKKHRKEPFYSVLLPAVQGRVLVCLPRVLKSRHGGLWV